MLEKFMVTYYLLALMDEMEAVYKFQTAYLVCQLTGSELPPVKKLWFKGHLPGVILGGWVRRFLFSRVNLNMRSKIQLAFSLLDAKRGADPISIFLQEKALFDHADNMEGKGYSFSNDETIRPPLLKEDHVANGWGTRTTKLEHIKRTTANIMKKVYKQNWDRFQELTREWRLPSRNSCYEAPKSGSGPLARITLDMTMSADSYPEHISMCPKAGVHRATLVAEDGQRVPIYGSRFRMQDLIDYTRMRTGLACKAGPLKAHVHKILEPFKVRTITSSNCYVYTTARCIQPALHRLLSEEPVFELIGHPEDVETINRHYRFSVLYKREYWEGLSDVDKQGKFTYFVAGDYKNATDCMHPDLPRSFIANLGLFGLDKFWVSVLEATLGGHIMKYSFDKGVDGERIAEMRKGILQLWGQLMGSPTSFPVLCVINLALFWAACEAYEDRQLSWDYIMNVYRPLINGDDISFLSNPDHYRCWSNYASCAGMTPSPGKNYTTHLFVNINSTNFWAQHVDLGDAYLCVGFDLLFKCNAGLIKGKGKVQGDTRDVDGVDTLQSAVAQVNVCLRGASEEEKQRVYEVFLHRMKDRLLLSKRPWNLPVAMGGLGLPRKWFPQEPSKRQVWVAYKQLHTYKDLSDRTCRNRVQELINSNVKLFTSDIECVKESIVLGPDSSDPEYMIPDISSYAFDIGWSRRSNESMCVWKDGPLKGQDRWTEFDYDQEDARDDTTLFNGRGGSLGGHFDMIPPERRYERALARAKAPLPIQLRYVYTNRFDDDVLINKFCKGHVQTMLDGMKDYFRESAQRQVFESGVLRNDIPGLVNVKKHQTKVKWTIESPPYLECH